MMHRQLSSTTTLVTADQDFTYDALYRLIKAKGREQDSLPSFVTEDNFNSSDSNATNPIALRNYIQHYCYDAVGNITKLKHCAGTTGSYTRTYTYTAGTNRLASTQAGNTSTPTTYAYTYDARGNMITMPHLANMAYDKLSQFVQLSNGTGSPVTSYQYSGGQRVRKYTVNGSVTEERLYLGGFERYRKYNGTTKVIERITIHVADDAGRIAMIERRTTTDATVDNNTPAYLQRYVYSNHLGSAALELDETAAIISYEEYHPYGTTAYQAKDATMNAVAKRYRFTGKERDDESGLYYHGARYYIPWLGRWCAVDPLEEKYAPQSCYVYCSNDPISKVDPDGRGERKGHRAHAGLGGGLESVKQDVWKGIVNGGDKKTAASDKSKTSTPHTQYRFPETTVKPVNTSNNRQGTMRAISEDEMHGYNFWHYMKEANPETSYPTNFADAILNPAWRFLQQYTSGITGQKTVHNLDGTDAWQTNSQVGAGGNVSPLDLGQTGLMLAMEGLPQEGLGNLKKSARTLEKDEHILITPAEGLQSSQSGKFKNVILGTKGDKATTYLWTIDDRGINIALEKTPMTTNRGNIVHSNISPKAYIAGEAWFESENTVIINAGSGRFGDGNPKVTEKTWEAAIYFWNKLGYEVKFLPLKAR